MQSFYDDVFADTFLAAHEGGGEAAAALLWRELGLRAGERVLDQGAGLGRVARALARRGCDVVAVDVVASYVERARRLAAAEGVRVTWVCGAMERFVAAPACDAGFSWHTSLGLGDDAACAAALGCAAASLRLGGRFLVDVGNLAGVLADFRPELRTTLSLPSGAVALTRRSELDLLGGWLRQAWTFELPDGRTALREASLRLMLPHTLAALCEGAGLRVLRALGDHEGGPLTPRSPRCILVTERAR